MKVIIDVAENFKPNHQDMLMYNELTKSWEVKNFQVVCKEQNSKIAELEKEVRIMRDKFSELSAKYNRVLEIVKEHIKNG